jgi:hypothetical protein
MDSKFSASTTKTPILGSRAKARATSGTILGELRVVVCSFGHVLLIGMLEETDELAGSACFSDGDELLNRHLDE